MKPLFRPQSRGWPALAWSLWDGLLLYLPLLTMAALALGTYWLVRTTEPADSKNTSAAAPEPDANDVDYFMQGFTVRLFDAQGRLKNEIFGSEARHFTASDRLEIDTARIRSVNQQGQTTMSTADRAYSNSDASEIKLVGNAQVVRQAQLASPAQAATPALAFQGNFLHVFREEEKMLSDQPVQMSRGSDRFSGNAFTFDNTTRVLELKGNVRVLLQPRNSTVAPSPPAISPPSSSGKASIAAKPLPAVR